MSFPGAPGRFAHTAYRLYNGVFTGALGTFAGDVDTDGTDLIAINTTNMTVMLAG